MRRTHVYVAGAMAWLLIAACGDDVGGATETASTSTTDTTTGTTTNETTTTGPTTTDTTTTGVTMTGTTTMEVTTGPTTGTSTTDETTTTGSTTDETTTTGSTTDETSTTTTGSTTDETSTTTTGSTTDETSTTETSTTGDTTTETSTTDAVGECGDGVLDAGEECDDNNMVDTDECTNACTNAVCGDGVTQEGVDQCDDANQTNADTCSNKCVKTPTEVVLGLPIADTSQYGNLNGGLPFDDICPAGHVLVGFSGNLSNVDGYHGQIQGACAPLGLSVVNDQFVVTLGTLTDLPLRGLFGSEPWGRVCPMDQAVVGFSGRSGGLVDQITFTCAPLVIVEAMDGTFSITTGATTDLAAIGGNGGEPFPQTNCPMGQVGTRQIGRAGDGIDAFGLGCSTPTLTF